MKKKIILAGVVLSLVLSVHVYALAAAGSAPAVFVSGKEVGTAASVDGGNIYLPLRPVGEALGYQVLWNGQDKVITMTAPGSEISIDMNSREITANGHAYYMSAGPGIPDDGKIIVGSTYMGEGFFTDNLGVVVGQDLQTGVRLESVDKNSLSIENVTETAETERLKTTIQYPQVEGLNSSAVQEKINSTCSDLAVAAKNEGLKNAADMQAAIDSGYIGGPTQCETYFDYRLKYNQDGLLSVVFLDYQYSGGAHGLTIQSSFTFDLQTGQEYSLKDLMRDDADYVSFISKVVRGEIDARPEELPEITTFEKIGENQAYYLSNDAVVIYFQQYEYFPYAAGIQEFPVEFSSLKDMLKPEFGLLAD